VATPSSKLPDRSKKDTGGSKARPDKLLGSLGDLSLRSAKKDSSRKRKEVL